MEMLLSLSSSLFAPGIDLTFFAGEEDFLNRLKRLEIIGIPFLSIRLVKIERK
jgi:hypothetical protein